MRFVAAVLLLAAVCTASPTFIRFFASTPLPDRNLAHTPSAWKVAVNSATETWLSLLPTWDRLKATAVNGSVVPFVDEIVTVRVLGGWDAKYGHGNASDDIIDGDYRFRWELLDQRVDPWVFGANKSILFVLDNVPYVFTDGHPKLGPFGQDAPPANYSKFHWFVRRVVGHLKERYGATYVAERFRFRVGTEPDGPRYGNITQYKNSYRAAADAVKLESPRSPVGAGNWLHQTEHYATDQVFEREFYTWTRAHNVAVDFVAQSDYVQGIHHSGGRRYPCFIRNGSDAMQTYARWYGKPAMPVEVHEFAPLYNVDRRTSSEPGSFGVSFYVACWAAALSSGVHRIFHWGTAHEGGVSGELWTGYGWAMAMADLLVGREILAIDVPEGCQRGAFALASSGVTIVTAFDPYRFAAPFNVSFRVPHNVSRVYTFDAAVSPFDTLLADAMRLGYTKYDDGLPYGIHALLNADGREWIRNRTVWDKYMGLQRTTFTASEQSLAAGDEVAIPGFTTLVLVE